MAVVQTKSQIIQLSIALANEWSVVNPKLPNGMPGWESDTNKLKIGNGVTSWNNLPYVVDEQIIEEYVTLLENANMPYGAAVLTEDGLLELNQLPPQAQKNVRYVADIAARDNIPIEERGCIVVVLDASGDIVEIEDAIEHTITNVYDVASGNVTEGGTALIDFGTIVGVQPEDFEGHTKSDITVKRGGAVYTWNGTATNGTWFKISEFESMDIDFSVYFNVVMESIDIIMDGIEFIKYTTTERGKLELTMNMDDIFIYKGMTPNKLKTL
jgi:hypothetical protein